MNLKIKIRITNYKLKHYKILQMNRKMISKNNYYSQRKAAIIYLINRKNNLNL